MYRAKLILRLRLDQNFPPMRAGSVEERAAGGPSAPAPGPGAATTGTTGTTGTAATEGSDGAGWLAGGGTSVDGGRGSRVIGGPDELAPRRGGVRRSPACARPTADEVRASSGARTSSRREQAESAVHQRVAAEKDRG